VPPSVWLPLVWGGEKAPVFDSSAQAERIIGILMHRFNDICRMFGENAAGFEPLLYTREVDGKTEWIGEDWCVGFMEAAYLSFDEWQPLFDDKPACALLAPILTLGTEVGWKELDASADPEGESEAALEALGPRWKPSLPWGTQGK
jgi:yecA family protein